MTTIIGVIFVFTHMVSSANGSFNASVIYGGSTELSVKSFTLCNQNHEIIYTKENIDLNTFYISNSGTVFALNEQKLFFYYSNGEEKLLKDLNYPNGADFEPDHSLFFVSDKDGIFTYSDNGKIKYTFNPGRLFSSLQKGSIVAIISNDTLSIYYDGVRKFERKLLTPYARSIVFSTDAKSIIIEEPSLIEVFDSPAGQELK